MYYLYIKWSEFSYRATFFPLETPLFAHGLPLTGRDWWQYPLGEILYLFVSVGARPPASGTPSRTPFLASCRLHPSPVAASPVQAILPVHV